jgi:hypothetical protein
MSQHTSKIRNVENRRGGTSAACDQQHGEAAPLPPETSHTEGEGRHPAAHISILRAEEPV